MDHFELHSEYKPTGDQPQAIERLVRGFKEGNQCQTLLGVTGSGKTFTLAVEYIKHLIINPRAYRQILAVTFTNKATAEMKERILTQLYGIWKGAPSSEAYLERIKNYKLKIKGEGGDRLTDGEIRQRAGMALQYMLHDYSRFRVETIDSFFQSVMRNLAREMAWLMRCIETARAAGICPPAPERTERTNFIR